MILEHRAMQRQGRKLLTKNGPLSAGTAHYGWPWPINVVLVSGRIADEALSAAEGRTLSGAPKAKKSSRTSQTRKYRSFVVSSANASYPILCCSSRSAPVREESAIRRHSAARLNITSRCG